jgi:hypothetical protein
VIYWADQKRSYQDNVPQLNYVPVALQFRAYRIYTCHLAVSETIGPDLAVQPGTKPVLSNFPNLFECFAYIHFGN